MNQMWANTTNAKSGIWPKSAYAAKTSSVTEDNFSHLADNTRNRIFTVMRQMTKGQKQPISTQTSSVTEDVFSRICGFIKRRVY
jgi:hypothetical protein